MFASFTCFIRLLRNFSQQKQGWLAAHGLIFLFILAKGAMEEMTHFVVKAEEEIDELWTKAYRRTRREPINYGLELFLTFAIRREFQWIWGHAQQKI